MQGLLQRLEDLFEAAGANAGHEFRGDPFRRRIKDLRGLDEELDALALGWAVRSAELICFEAVSIHPHALASAVGELAEGMHAVWMLDEDRAVVADDGPAALYAANPTDRHVRMLHAVYRSGGATAP